jgi:endonuclease III
MISRDRAENEAKLLQESYPDAHCALDFTNAFTLLVATVLSAQTTDVRVNSITPSLFAVAPDPISMATLSLDELEKIIYPLGTFRRKAVALQGLAQKLCDDFDGVVPGTREELMSLPGVGRKTANVVLGNWFGYEEITVDTHVGRVTKRLKWQNAEDPLKAEKQLRELMPDAPWTQLCHEIIFHGRRICHSRNPECGKCILNELCDVGIERLAIS